MQRRLFALLALAFVFTTTGLAEPGKDGKRPMTFMDIMEMRSLRSRALSPDGKWLLYSVAVPVWSKGESYTDLFVASTQGGEPRQLTFTKEKNEDNPLWSKDGSFFSFVSDREGKRQIYFMRLDGGEARKVTDHKDGVGSMGWSKDGAFLAYTAGRAEDQQIWLLTQNGDKPVRLTKHTTPVRAFYWAPDSRHIYFLAADSLDKDDQKRREKKFDVRIMNQPDPCTHLWVVDVGTKAESRLTSGNEFTIRAGFAGEPESRFVGSASVAISKDGRKMAFRGSSPDRYATGEETEVYLLDVASGKLTRVTNNRVSEGMLSFSPDSRWLAFTAPDEFTQMRNTRVYLVSADGGPVKKLGDGFEHDVTLSFWGPDGKAIYFNEQVGAATNLYRLSVDGGRVQPVTNEKGNVNATRDEDTGLVLLTYADPTSPPDLYVAPLDGIAQRSRWTRVTRTNPQVENMALGATEAIRWKSSDGALVEGILIKPLDYKENTRYPLIVQLHGGPASASTLAFVSGSGTYPHIYAANGYMVLQPNYRGSTGYGEKFKMQIAGDYFRQAFDDIMSGVDHLIGQGMVDPNAMGMMGWSAGGHWSNWTLVSTDRFKAISTGAGAVNWISMYAETDMQPIREFYFKGRPYDNWDHYLEVSPLKYIQRAKTPTLIHVGEADPRVPKPQSDELHMALKKLGVPTEYIVYPGMPHGITRPRYQMVKMVAEFNWFEKWIKGKPGWLDWKVLLDTLKDEEDGEGLKKEHEEAAPDDAEKISTPPRGRTRGRR